MQEIALSNLKLSAQFNQLSLNFLKQEQLDKKYLKLKYFRGSFRRAPTKQKKSIIKLKTKKIK